MRLSPIHTTIEAEGPDWKSAASSEAAEAPNHDWLEQIAEQAEAEGITADEWAVRAMELFLRNFG